MTSPALQNETATNFTSGDLWLENDAFARAVIPSMVYVAVTMVVGIPGNALTVYVYGVRFRPATQNFLIVCLAVSDLIISLIAMPTEIADLRFHLTFASDFACRLLRFLSLFCNISSNCILVVIAVDRHRRVCRPLHRQMSAREARLGAAASVGAAAVLSWPLLVMTGLRTTETKVEGLWGKDCSFSDDYKDTVYPWVLMAALGAGFLVFTGLLSVLYFRIWWQARAHRHGGKSFTVQSWVRVKGQGSVSSAPRSPSTVEMSVGSLRESPVAPVSPTTPISDTVTIADNSSSTSSDSNRTTGSSVPTITNVNNNINTPLSTTDSTASSDATTTSTLAFTANNNNNNISSNNNNSSSYSTHGTTDTTLISNTITITTTTTSDNNDTSPETRDTIDSRNIITTPTRHTTLYHTDTIAIRSTTTTTTTTTTNNNNNNNITLHNTHTTPISDTTTAASTATPETDVTAMPIFSVTTSDSVSGSPSCPASTHPVLSPPSPLHHNSRRESTSATTSQPALTTTTHDSNNSSSNSTTPTSPSYTQQNNHEDSFTITSTNINPTINTITTTTTTTTSNHNGNGGQLQRTGHAASVNHRLTVSTINLRYGESLASPTTPQHTPVPAEARRWTGQFPKKKTKASVDKTTLVAFAVTLVFVFSFLPYLILMLVRALVRDFDHRLSGSAELNSYNVFVRSYFINSAANPIIYGVINARFRGECVTLFRAMTSRVTSCLCCCCCCRRG